MTKVIFSTIMDIQTVNYNSQLFYNARERVKISLPFSRKFIKKYNKKV